MHPEAQRMLEGAGDDVLGDALCPIGLGQESVDRIQIQLGRVGADDEVSVTVFLRHKPTFGQRIEQMERI
jgi:hypothetical protein